MKKIIKTVIFISIFVQSSYLYANDLEFYLQAAFKNNPKLNAERENLEAIRQNINISRSEFLPSLTIEGNQTSIESSNQTNQSGSNLSDTNLNTEEKSIVIDQKVFSGFQNLNSLKKSKLEVEKAKSQLRQVEQEILLKTAEAFYDLIFKNKNKSFNIDNVDLFERQVETDKARLQKGEINLTDLAQSESSLSGANAKLIKAETELITSKAEFEKITRVSIPEDVGPNDNIIIKLPTSLEEAITISEKKNPKLKIAKLDSLISEKELSIEKSKLSPSASLNYSKSENSDLSSTIDKSNKETVKATLSWPIIKGGKNYASIKKSKHKRNKSKLILNDQENDVKTSVANAWSVYKSTASLLEATKSQLKAAEIANEGITLEYDSGNTRTTLELIQSRTLLLESRITFARSERDLIISKFKLLAEIGDLSLNTLKTP